MSIRFGDFFLMWRLITKKKKEKTESNTDLKNRGIMPWRIWDLGLQGQHIPMVWSLKWEIPATGYDWIQHWS